MAKHSDLLHNWVYHGILTKPVAAGYRFTEKVPESDQWLFHVLLNSGMERVVEFEEDSVLAALSIIRRYRLDKNGFVREKYFVSIQDPDESNNPVYLVYEVWTIVKENTREEFDDLVRAVYCYHIGDDLYLQETKGDCKVISEGDCKVDSLGIHKIICISKKDKHPSFETNIWNKPRYMVNAGIFD